MQVALCVFAASTVSAVTPTQKVVQLLQDMAAKGTSEMRDEQVKFSTFTQWCANTEKSKTTAIAKEKDTIAALSAEIDKLNADIAVLDKEIEHLDNNVEKHKTDLKAASVVRAGERADTKACQKDYHESLDSLSDAIEKMEAEAAAIRQAAGQEALVQLTIKAAKVMPAETKNKIMSFLQTSSTNGQEPHYSSHGEGITDLLKKTQEEFRQHLKNLDKYELNSKYDYEQLQQSVTNEVDADTRRSHKKSKIRAENQQRVAEAEGELKEEEANLASDTQYLNDLQAECATKTTDFDARQKLRGEELEAIGKAIDILSSDSVSGAADRHLPGLAQTSFLQLRAVAKVPLQDQVAAYLQEAAQRMGSRLLEKVADSAEADPFNKVKKMIKDMIVKLKEEANEEAEHNEWCNTELTSNKQTRSDKTAEIEELNSKIESLTASKAKLSIEVKELQADVAELEDARAKATEDRTAESAKNKATIKDAQEAQEAVKNALAVLKEFYDKAKDSTALMQSATDDAPETFSEPYKGMQGESGGVVGMLEVIQSDFARLEADTTASEEASAEEYKTFSKDSKTDLATKNADIKGKSDTITRRSEAISQTTEELGETQKEMDAATDYYDKLKPSCVSSGTDYDDRVKQREGEIQSLKEALKILRGDDIPMPVESGRVEYTTGASHQGE